MAGGRPLKFKNKDDLLSRIESYFSEVKMEEWTITGLALALDTSRETLMNYEDREEFFDTIKKAKEMVHNAYEIDLRKKGRSGDIFALKNFGWSDRQEIDHTTQGEKIDSSDAIKELTLKLNEIHRENGIRSNGTSTSSLDEETSN